MSGAGTELDEPDLSYFSEVVEQWIREDEDPVHWACCEDREIAVCGADLVGHEDVSNDPGSSVDCPPCLELEDRCTSASCPVSALRALKGL